MTPDLEIEPGPHWWDASALTTVAQLVSARLSGQEVTVRFSFDDFKVCFDFPLICVAIALKGLYQL